MNTIYTEIIPVILGFALHKLWILSKRSRSSKNTPANFSLWFWIKDNWASTLSHGILWYCIIMWTKPALEYVATNKAVPDWIKETLHGLPLTAILFTLGWLSAHPLSVLEKKGREFKKSLAKMVRK